MKNQYTQLCVLRGVTDELPELGTAMTEAFDCRFKMATAFETLPDSTGPGGRRDVLFWVHDGDVGKFTVRRLAYGISWWEDYLSNSAELIPDRIRDEYPNTWEG